jgi:hypothetical protein
MHNLARRDAMAVSGSYTKTRFRSLSAVVACIRHDYVIHARKGNGGQVLLAAEGGESNPP